MQSAKTILRSYSSSNARNDTMIVYMVAPVGRTVNQKTLEQQFNKNFFPWVADKLKSPYQKKVFFENRKAAEDFQQINDKAGLYEVIVPITVCKKDVKEPNQLAIDNSQITAESIQNVTVMELGTYQWYKITNPYHTESETSVIETISPPQSSSILKK